MNSRFVLIGILLLLMNSPSMLFAGEIPFNHTIIDNNGPDRPWAKIVGDFDGDGYLDVAIGGRKGPLVWYKYPDWVKTVICQGGYETVDGEAGDVDGDGDLDIVMGGIVWYENPRPFGDPAKAAWREHRVADHPTHDVELGDLDKDGDLDIVTRNQSAFGKTKHGNTIHIWRQYPKFVWTEKILQCPEGEGLKVADIDRDRDLDIVIGGIWYENPKDILQDVWAPHEFAEWYPNATVETADINGDGLLDVILSPSELKGNYYKLSWFEAPSDPKGGVWIEHVVQKKIECVIHGLQAADMNNDGTIDIIYSEMHQGQDPDEVAIYFNQGEGLKWTKQVLSNKGSHLIQVADFGNDGDMDIMGANHASAYQPVELWENRTAPLMHSSGTTGKISEPHSVSAARLVFSDSFERIGENGLPVGWETWKPYHLDLLFESESNFSHSGSRCFRLSGNGHKHAKGALRKKLVGLKTGAWYKVTVYYTTQGIDSGINSKIIPVIKVGPNRHFRIAVPVSVSNGWVRAESIFQLPANANETATIDLFAGWIPDGSVYWDDLSVQELENYSPPQKLIKVAVIDAVPLREGGSLENCDFYVSQINDLCKKENPDVICLTETFNIINVKNRNSSAASVSMDSEYMNRLKKAALNNKVNLVGSIAENENGILFNTGFLINRKGELVDKYHKAQLAETEILFSDRSRGDELKIMQADFGKIGILICYDYQYPEFARSLALMGADILFVPIAGDLRLIENDTKVGMEIVGKAIAMENRIPVVFAKRGAVPDNPSRIINNKAEVVAQTTDGHYIVATLDLKNKVTHWTGADFKKAYFTFRRPELYHILINDSLKIYTNDGPVFVPVPEVKTK